MDNEKFDPSKEQFEELKQSVATAASEAITNALGQRESDLVARIRSGVTEALQNQRLSVELHDGKKDSKKFAVLLAAIPASATVVAVVLGFGIWLKQKDIEQTITTQDRNLTTQLALTQEFYKRKFDIYEKAHHQMTTLLGAIQDFRLDPKAQTEAFDSLTELDMSSKTNQLYMTDDVSKGLSDVWTSAKDFMLSQGTVDAVEQKISEVEKKMKDELDSANIGKLTPCAAQTRQATPSPSPTSDNR